LADDFERHSQETLADPERYFGNPVNAYLLIKRFTADWERLVDTQIRSSSAEGRPTDTIPTPIHSVG